MENNNNGIDLLNIVNTRLDFNRKREEGEEDLVEFVSTFLKAIDEKQYNAFINHEVIVSIKDLNPVSQRVIINKYFNTQLLIFRRYFTFNITELLMYLVNDGDIEYWKSCYKDIIFPFLRNQNENVKETL